EYILVNGSNGGNHYKWTRTPLSHDHLYVKWGESNTEECQLEYDIQSKISQEKQSIIMTEAICK
ncbi:hypothetical protein OPU39_12935, partial [Acinetobacter nosocomialis]|nr:hypothetical protein [Acinetobacter nosocomialis]